MATIQLNDFAMHTHGSLPEIGSAAPEVPLTKTDLSTVTFADFKDMAILVNVYPSIDTDVCFDSVKKFSSQMPAHQRTQLLCISMDLPFTLRRIAEGEPDLQDIRLLSDFRNREFGASFGLTIADGPLAGLLARAVLVLNAQHQIIYTELVTDISNPPNYTQALAALSQ